MDRQTGKYWHCTSAIDSKFSISYPTNKIHSNILWYQLEIKFRAAEER